MIFLPVLTCLIISPLMQKVFHDSEEIIYYERKLKKTSVRQSHPRFCGALRKDTLAKFFLMCLSFRADDVAFVKPINNSFLLSSSSFLIGEKIGDFSAPCLLLSKVFQKQSQVSNMNIAL